MLKLSLLCGAPAWRRRLSRAGGCVALCAGLLALILADGASCVRTANAAAGRSVDVAELMKPSPIPENVLGSADAPITIVEYSSLTCPHCAHFHDDVLPTLKEKYVQTGKARYILREYPLDNLALAGFLVARCIDRDRYFAFVDLLYARQESWARKAADPEAALRLLARQAGMGDERFTQCLRDDAMLRGISWVKNQGESMGVRSTPTFFINGVEVRGEFSREKLDEVLAPYLAK